MKAITALTTPITVTGRLFHRERSRGDDGRPIAQMEFTDATRTRLIQADASHVPGVEKINTGAVCQCRVIPDGPPWQLVSADPCPAPLPQSWRFLPSAVCPAPEALAQVVEGLDSLRPGPLATFVSEVLWNALTAVPFVTAPVKSVDGLPETGGLLIEGARVMTAVLRDERIPLLQRELGAVAGLFQRMGMSWIHDRPYEYVPRYADGARWAGSIVCPTFAWLRLRARQPRVAGGIMRLWHFLEEPEFGEVEREYRVFRTLLDAVRIAPDQTAATRNPSP